MDSFIPVTDLSLKENIDKLLSIQAKIVNAENKIKFQQEEIIKTVDIIEKFKKCYDDQNEALGKFNEDYNNLKEEYNILLEMVQGKTDTSDINFKNLGNNSNADNLFSKNVNITADSTLSNQTTDAKENKITDAKNATKSKLFSKSNPKLPTDINFNTPIKRRQDDALNASIDQQKSVKKKKSDNLDSKSQTNKTKEPLLDVLVKVQSYPLEQVTSIDGDPIIHKIWLSNDDIYICGSHGLLTNHQKFSIAYYSGHQNNVVKDFYIYNNQSIFSVGEHTVIRNRLNDCNNHYVVSTFKSEICCTCANKQYIYGSLSNSNLFIIDMKLETMQIFHKISASPFTFMVVVRVNGNRLLITGNQKGDIISYSLNSVTWLRTSSILTVNGKLKGIKTDSTAIVCYTDHGIFLLDKLFWRISLIREITNEIKLLEANMNHLIVLDNYNVLHKYVIKRGRIQPGSTVENLPMKGRTTAMHFSYQTKKIYFACGNLLYKQSF